MTIVADMPPRTCATYGLLGLRRRTDGEVLDAHERFRETTAEGHGFGRIPLCGDRKRDFGQDMRGREPTSRSDPDPLKQLLDQEKGECSSWMEWRIGSTPKAHMARRNTERLEEMRRQTDLKVAELEQQSQTQMLSIAEATRRANETLLTITTHNSGT